MRTVRAETGDTTLLLRDFRDNFLFFFGGRRRLLFFSESPPPHSLSLSFWFLKKTAVRDQKKSKKKVGVLRFYVAAAPQPIDSIAERPLVLSCCATNHCWLDASDAVLSAENGAETAEQFGPTEQGV